MTDESNGGGGVAVKSGTVVNGRGGKFASGSGLTEKQAAFVAAMIANGGNQTGAARSAGYQTPAVDGWRLMRKPAVLEALHEKREAMLQGELASLAMRTLGEIMQDETAPAAARFNAARFVLEGAGHGLQAKALVHRIGEGVEKPLSELSSSELEAFIRAREAEVAALRTVSAPVMEAEVLPPTDSQ